MKKISKSKRTQVPGYFRYMLGDYEITSIYDGYVLIDLEYYFKQEKEKTYEQLKKGFADIIMNKGEFFTKLPVNTYLINTKKDLILVDAGGGGGSLLGPTMGLNEKNIILSGYKLEDITKIFLTHLHLDHLGGLIVEDKIMYPNATIYINQKELDYWLDKENYNEIIVGFLDVYMKNNQVKGFEEGEEIAEIKGILLPGHTPGHSGFEVTSDNESILFWGDLIHNYEIQFVNSDVVFDLSIKFINPEDRNAALDNNEKNMEQEVKTRKIILNKVVKEKTLIGGSHLPFPGIGHVVENESGTGYHWIPVPYIIE